MEIKEGDLLIVRESALSSCGGNDMGISCIALEDSPKKRTTVLVSYTLFEKEEQKIIPKSEIIEDRG